MKWAAAMLNGSVDLASLSEKRGLKSYQGLVLNMLHSHNLVFRDFITWPI